MSDLEKLENEALHIIREASNQFKNPACMWSVGKDSTTVVHLLKKAFFGKIPFPVIHIDTGRKFPEMYKFRDELVKKWGLNLLIAKNNEEINKGMGPEKGKFECCTKLKTEALKQLLEKHKFDALFLAIRRDEHGVRAKERFFSPRDAEFKWNYKDQPPEMWDLFKSLAKDDEHTRVHPILEWTELDVWKYIEKEKIPVNPLYFAKGGKRYRSLGCVPCTSPVSSTASNIQEIIQELKTTQVSERSGRSQDKEKTHMMQKLRALGYM